MGSIKKFTTAIAFGVDGYFDLIGCFTSQVFNQVGLVRWFNNRLGRCHLTVGLQSLVSLYLCKNFYNTGPFSINQAVSLPDSWYQTAVHETKSL